MPSLRQLFLQNLAQTSDAPLMLEIERAEGMYLYDRQGKAYMDLIAGIGVSSLGHRHPAVVDAVRAQLDKYLHTLVYGEFVLEPQVQLAALLAASLPDPLDSVYFVNSGTEAIEGAMKLAKRATGRPQIISCRRAYHGSSQGAASLMWPKDFTGPFHPLLPGVSHIGFNDFDDLEKIGKGTAAVVMETVQGEWGVRKPVEGYLRQVRDRCDETGALLVLDEVQAGYGRTGSLFAFEQYGIVPDILVLAKGMGGGMPIGAFVAAKELMRSLSFNPVLGHITTFGGHPVCCAAGLATLQTLLGGGLIGAVPAKEARFREGLQHRAIQEIRSAGLWLALELDSFDRVRDVIRNALKRGLVSDWFLFNDRSLRIAPPLIINDQQIDEACSILHDSLDEVYS